MLCKITQLSVVPEKNRLKFEILYGNLKFVYGFQIVHGHRIFQIFANVEVDFRSVKKVAFISDFGSQYKYNLATLLSLLH